MMNDEAATSRFIASLVKSLQSLCHGYMDFEKNIEIIGHIYVSVDSNQKFDYIVNEQVCKNDDESPTMFVSNSFHAQPNKRTVRTFTQNDVPLDLKTHSAKDVSGVDLSTFQSETSQGRSASRESSQSLSAGSESGSFSGSVRESSLSSTRQNPDKYVSRRKRHLNEISVKISPDVSPPPSRNRDGERRDFHDSSVLRSQYTLGASASKLARRISNELEKQGLANPAHSDSEIHSRLSSSNQSPSRVGRYDNSVSHQRHFTDDSSKTIDSVKDPPGRSEGPQLDDSIDLTRVKEEVIDDDHLFDQLDWTRTGREMEQESSFPRTGLDDPASEGQNAHPDDQVGGEDLGGASLYPVMIHQNTAGGIPMTGYGSPVFPQNFTEPSHTMSAGSSPIPSTSGQLSPGSAFASRRGQSGNSGRGHVMVNYGEFIRPTTFPLGRGHFSGYREKLKQENPAKWMNFMWRERERVKRERAVLKERDDEQALMKKERIRIQNRLRKRKERQRKREREMLAMLKTEPDSGHSTNSVQIQPQMPKFDDARQNDGFAIHPAFCGLPPIPQRCDVNM